MVWFYLSDSYLYVSGMLMLFWLCPKGRCSPCVVWIWHLIVSSLDLQCTLDSWVMDSLLDDMMICGLAGAWRYTNNYVSYLVNNRPIQELFLDLIIWFVLSRDDLSKLWLITSIITQPQLSPHFFWKKLTLNIPSLLRRKLIWMFPFFSLIPYQLCFTAGLP